jgi:uncharacterized cofD-like protein
MKNIVILGGGTGTLTLLSGLRKFPSNNSVIVSTADSGGSTGILRDDLGVVPPGDIRQCLLGLSYTEDAMQKLFAYRFDKGSLNGHNVGNIILAALQKIEGNVETAIIRAAKMLNVRGSVVPMTLYPTTLSATLENGKVIKGEHQIDEPKHNGKLHIKSMKLDKSKPANPRALKLLKEADVIVFGPGDLYTSTIPNILVPEIKAVIQKSKATKVLVSNIMNKYGQTNGFKASDFVSTLEAYLGTKIDLAIVNTEKPAASLLSSYKKNKSELVEADVKTLEAKGTKVIAESLIAKTAFKKTKGDSLTRSFLRHDSEKIAQILWKLVS